MMTIPKERALVLSDASNRGWATRRRRLAAAGNQNAAKSYAYSQLAIRGEVAQRIDYYLEVASYLDPLVDGPALAVAARLGVQAAHASAAIDAAEKAGEPIAESLRKHASYLLVAEMRSLAACSLTPQSRALLGLSRLDAAGRARAMTEATLEAYRPHPKDEPS
jgi:hypothetical protein